MTDVFQQAALRLHDTERRILDCILRAMQSHGIEMKTVALITREGQPGRTMVVDVSSHVLYAEVEWKVDTGFVTHVRADLNDTYRRYLSEAGF